MASRAVSTKKIINTDAAPAAVGPYSQAVQVDNTLYISGQIGMDPQVEPSGMGQVKGLDLSISCASAVREVKKSAHFHQHMRGELVSDDVSKQAKQALDNLGAILRAAGADYRNVVKATIMLTDINDFAKVNEVYAKYFTQEKPARAALQAAALPKQAKVEIEAIACMNTTI